MGLIQHFVGYMKYKIQKAVIYTAFLLLYKIKFFKLTKVKN